jgi:hypothetical protein
VGRRTKELVLSVPDIAGYEISQHGVYYAVSPDGQIGHYIGADRHPVFSGDWQVRGMTFHHWSNRPISWEEMKTRMTDGKDLYGYLWDIDHGTVRQWAKDKIFIYPRVGQGE